MRFRKLELVYTLRNLDVNRMFISFAKEVFKEVGFSALKHDCAKSAKPISMKFGGRVAWVKEDLNHITTPSH